MTERPRRRRSYAIIALAVVTNIYSTAGVIRDTSRRQSRTSIGTTLSERLLHSRISPTCFIVGGTRCCHRSGSFGETNIYRRRSLQIYSQDASRTSVTRSNVVSIDRDQREFFITDAQFVHLGPAARILTEEFYSQKTNFVTFQIERLKTVLSLESTFPNKQTVIQTDKAKRLTSLQKMIVACDAKDGKVVGFAEVDARSFRGNTNNINGDGDNESEATSAALQYSTANDRSSSNNEILRSYMYNLAVDKKWKRKGVASALVRACEQFVSDAHSDSCMERRLYLRVRKCNIAAIALYERLGYREMEPEEIQLSAEDINRDSLEDGELILFVKDLTVDDECTV